MSDLPPKSERLARFLFWAATTYLVIRLVQGLLG